ASRWAEQNGVVRLGGPGRSTRTPQTITIRRPHLRTGGCTRSAVVRPDDLAAGEHVPLHRLENLRTGRPMREVEGGVEGEYLEMVRVWRVVGGRSRSEIPDGASLVGALERAVRNGDRRSRRYSFFETGGARRNVV